MIVGNTYHNKHNGRTIEIEQHILTDTGVSLYYGVDVNNGHGDYYSLKNLEDHWIGNTTYPGLSPSELEQQQFEINSRFYQWVCEHYTEVAQEYHEVINFEE
jgi:myo-inositol catabolism protein IolC